MRGAQGRVVFVDERLKNALDVRLNRSPICSAIILRENGFG
jgi:hypothetical protein